MSLQTKREFWVVACGLGSGCTSSSVFEYLQSFGRIVSTKENNNWIAVQYDDELVAAQACAHQLVLLGDAVIGVLTASPQFLHELTAKTASIKNFLPTSEKAKEIEGKSSKTGEEALLIGGKPEPEHYEYDSSRPRSICERFFSWYFGWDMKEHQD